jgi:hypothetical protein
MKPHASFLVFALALSCVALGQEPADDDDRVDVKVIGPEIKTIELDEFELAEVLPTDGATGAFILGVEGKAQDDAKKPKKQDDRDGKVIEKEIDLGNGQTLRLRIQVTGGKDDGRFLGRLDRVRRPLAAPHAEHFKVFGDSVTHGAPKVFRFDSGHDRADGAKGSIDRAIRAFERAHETFMKSLKEEAAKEHAAEHGDKHEKKLERRAVVTKPDGGTVVIQKDKPGDAEAKVEVKRGRPLGGEVRVLDVAPGATAQREIDALRKEIRELEKMVRELKEKIAKKDE